jgi:hypothetical protein
MLEANDLTPRRHDAKKNTEYGIQKTEHGIRNTEYGTDKTTHWSPVSIEISSQPPETLPAPSLRAANFSIASRIT